MDDLQAMEKLKKFETLRDRFAMAALTGMLMGTIPRGDGVSNISKSYADISCKFADAMLEQRQKAGK